MFVTLTKTDGGELTINVDCIESFEADHSTTPPTTKMTLRSGNQLKVEASTHEVAMRINTAAPKSIRESQTPSKSPSRSIGTAEAMAKAGSKGTGVAVGRQTGRKTRG